ncbi:MAG: hypothetical protein MJY57_03285 [Bacteroidales bacterium]|nr:hypothetical protein [Bacteroidales bacterium]
MKKYFYTILAVAATLSSCGKGFEVGSEAITTIGATVEESTRAVVSSSDDTKVNWETGDRLGVFGTNASSEARSLAFNLTAGSGSTVGTFRNTSSDITAISAIMYPFQEGADWTGGKLTCEIPSVQTAVKGSFDRNAAVMYSIGNTIDVELDYAVRFLKFTIGAGDTGIHSITVSSTGTQLSGMAEITTSGVSAVSGQSLKSVTLTAGENQTFTSGDYYIAIMPVDIVAPTISIIRYESGHIAKEYAKAGTGNLEFASGKNVKPITVDYSTISTPTGREAVQLWADGPYWAKTNVGANAAQESGRYFAWGDIVGQTPSADSFSPGFSTVPTLVPANPAVLPPHYDAAAANWNTAWRMPTGGEDVNAEFNSLKSNTVQTLVWDYNSTGVSGVEITGKDSYSANTLFLPIAGNGYYNIHYHYSEIGDYWSNTRNPDNTNSACHLYFNYEGAFNPGSKDSERFRGFTVRAVIE